MPPQRRKIVPPSTTNKARKKVAGSGRKPAETVPSGETAPSTEPQAPTAAEPVTQSESYAESESAEPTLSLEKDAAHEESVDKTPDASESAVGDTPAPPASTNWVPSIVVGVVALLLAAFAVVAAIAPGTGIDNAAWVDQSASSEVTRAATGGLTALYKYNYETIDDDLAKARDYMGPELQEQTNQFLDAIKSGAQQSQTATDVDVMDIGLTRLESDKAELLASMNVSSTRAGVAYDSVMFPIVVNMEKIDGRWVVSATELK